MQILDKMRSVKGDLRNLWTAIFIAMSGFGIYVAVFYNFATEYIKIEPQDLGIVEGVREVPGLLCAGIIALLMGVSEPVIAFIAFLVFALGLFGHAAVESTLSLAVWSFVWSMGMHLWLPLQNSLALSLSVKGREGTRVGQTVSVMSLAMLTGMLAVFIVGYRLSFQTWFIAGGVLATVGALFMLRIRRDVGVEKKPRIVVKKKYWLYYALTFLEGSRRQIFTTFAIYALTKVFETPLPTVALLMMANSAISFFGAQYLGRLIDRTGERKILLTSYATLVAVFIGYGVVDDVSILFGLFLVDNVFFLSTNCLTTYLQKTAEPQDVMPTLSFGVTVNHMAAVLVPPVGGFLWATYGYPVTFYSGAGIAAMSFAIAFFIRKKSV